MTAKFASVTLVVVMLNSCGPGAEDRQPPDVEILNPGDGGVVCNTCDVSVLGHDDAGVTLIELYIDDELVKTIDDSAGAYPWNTRTVSDNSAHTIYARAYDLTGNENVSETTNVTAFNNLDGTEIFVWVFDPHDIFFDSAFHDSVDCGDGLEQALLANALDYDRTPFLPPDLTAYKIGFVTLGWGRC